MCRSGESFRHIGIGVKSFPLDIKETAVSSRAPVSADVENYLVPMSSGHAVNFQDANLQRQLKLMVIRLDRHLKSMEPQGASVDRAVMAKTIISFCAGVSGAVNLYGLSGRTPDALDKLALWGAIIGTVLLHTGGAQGTFQEIEARPPGFQKKTPTEKAQCIFKHIAVAVLPLLSALPDAALAYLGVKNLTGQSTLGGIAAFCNGSAETVTFNLQLWQAWRSFMDGMKGACFGYSHEGSEKLLKQYQIVKGLSNSDAFKTLDKKECGKQRVIIREILKDRRAQKDIQTLLKLKEEGSNVDLTVENIERFAGRSAWFQRLKSGGQAVLSVALPALIFIASAKYFSSRGLVSIADLDLPENSTLTGCDRYKTEVSSLTIGLMNGVGCCAAISASILGSRLVQVIMNVLRTADNLHLAYQNKELMKEVKALMLDRWKTKVPSFVIAVLFAYCYQSLVAQTSEYADELAVVERCDIDGFYSILPDAPQLRPLILIGALAIPVPYYYLILFLLFSVIFNPSNSEGEAGLEELEELGGLEEVLAIEEAGDSETSCDIDLTTGKETANVAKRDEDVRSVYDNDSPVYS
ncbi:hypothetical protein [Endozoicomonas ascidiicola]|uniref:hypothetical protein n=1 Tax=Endozoicomonas ascidiicola TaxID=1698521 RepID=UPI001560B816|nr:hypothetical protein [Endozoicomonas ascidiicola]